MHDKGILGLKGIAILGVVFHHIANRRFDASVRESIAVLPAVFSWCVLAFIAAAGWVHSISEEKRRSSMGAFALHRAKRLLLPFLGLVLLYSFIWQLIQLCPISGLSGEIPKGFIDKVVSSLPMIGVGRAVAEQLYFLPLLFIICLIAHFSLRCFLMSGLAAICGLSFCIGVLCFPHVSNTGFSVGIIVWGVNVYSAAFLMHRFRGYRSMMFKILIAQMVAVVFLVGVGGLQKLVPLMLLAVIDQIRLPQIPLLHRIGQASGTIFAYHTPFMLQPLVIVATLIPSSVLGFNAVIFASLFCVGFCTWLFYKLKSTPLAFLLM